MSITRWRAHRREPPAGCFPARKGSGGGQCPGGESPAPAGDRRRVPEVTGAERVRARGGHGREEGKEPSEAARSPTPAKILALLCSFSPNWKDHISPRFTLWAVQVHPSKAHEDGGVFPFSVLSQRRLGEGRLFPASKTVRNSLPKCVAAPCTPSPGSSRRGGPLRGWLPALPSWHPLRLPSSPLPRAWATPAYAAPCQRGAGCPSHPGDGSSSPAGGERRGQDRRGRPGRAGWGQGQEGGGGAASPEGTASGVHGAQTPPAHTGRNHEPTPVSSIPAGDRAAVTAHGQETWAPGTSTLCGEAEQGKGLGVPVT